MKTAFKKSYLQRALANHAGKVKSVMKEKCRETKYISYEDFWSQQDCRENLISCLLKIRRVLELD